MKHPLSTVFNIFYLIFAVAALVQAWHGTLWVKGVAAIVYLSLAVASTGYHWTERRWWQRADITTIYGTFFMAMAYQLSTYGGLEEAKWMLVICFLGLSVAMPFTYEDWSHTQIGMLGIINLFLLFPRTSWLIFGIAAGLFMGGLILGRIAERHPKESKAYDRIHAAWKPPTAAGIFLLLL